MSPRKLSRRPGMIRTCLSCGRRPPRRCRPRRGCCATSARRRCAGRTRTRTAPRARPARPWSRCWSAASTPWCTGPAWPAPSTRPASWSCTATSRSTARRWTGRASGSSRARSSRCASPADRSRRSGSPRPARTPGRAGRALPLHGAGGAAHHAGAHPRAPRGAGALRRAAGGRVLRALAAADVRRPGVIGRLPPEWSGVRGRSPGRRDGPPRHRRRLRRRGRGRRATLRGRPERRRLGGRSGS
jgi:hypothetical protein